LRFVEGNYTDGQQPTTQASYLEKSVYNKKGEKARLSIWDTAGQERFYALGPIYYRGADGALIVYDITDASSFNRVQAWTKELRKMIGGEEYISISIIGNKMDLESKRNVDEEEVLRYAASIGATHFHASAKLGKGTDDIFHDLTKRMFSRRKRRNVENVLTGDFDASGGQNLILLDSSTQNEDSNCYC